MIIHDTIHTSLLDLRSISYRIILPSNCRKTVLWLHGRTETSDRLIEHGIFKQMAEEYGIAILFPDVPDNYYLNQTWNSVHCLTEDFLIQEFLPAVTAKYNLPSKHDRLFIAGISMGGFGSLLIGCHHPELFGKIACISGAFIIDDILLSNLEVIGSAANAGYFASLFGDLPSLWDDAERNPWIAAQSVLLTGELPPIYLTCGTSDQLIDANRKMFQRLQSAGTDVTWSDAPGVHKWEFFTPAVERVFAWLAS